MQLPSLPTSQHFPANDPFVDIDERDQSFPRRGRGRKANPSLLWIIAPAILAGLIGGMAAGLWEAGSKESGMAVAITIGVSLLMALIGSVFGVILWGLAKLHRGLAYGLLGVVMAAWVLFIAYDRLASRGQRSDRHEGAGAVEELPPNRAVENALAKYESACDELARLYAKERQLKITHRENERWRKGAMDLAANVGDFEQIKRLTYQAIEEGREMQKLSDEILDAAAKWETQGRSLAGLLDKDLKRIETHPADQQKLYLERHERWQERQR